MAPMFFSDMRSAGLARLYKPVTVPRRELEPSKAASEGLELASVPCFRAEELSSFRPAVSNLAML